MHEYVDGITSHTSKAYVPARHGLPVLLTAVT